MQFKRFDSPSDFYDHVKDFLCANEAANNLILGLTALVMSPTSPYTEPVFMGCVEVDAEIVAVAFRTPPHKLILSDIAPEYMESALDLILQSAFSAYEYELAGTIGPTHIAKAFAQKWGDATRIRTTLTMQERIYQLHAVIPVEGVSGHMRHAVEADRKLLKQWITNFVMEIWNDEALVNAEKRVDRMLSAPPEELGTFLWENDGEAVSMALYTGPTPNGCRVGFVYTPQAHRKHGYASAVVAGVSQTVLDMGRKHVFLFTDLANPTSNHIYQEIGYRPVCDVDDYTFG